MTWEEVCDDPSLQDLFYRIELNRWGNIEMSPLNVLHSERQSRISQLLRQYKTGGIALNVCPIQTAENTKVADAAWISDERRRASTSDAMYTVAPEICAEVLTPDNMVEEALHKRHLYLQAGALEFWLCDAHGGMRFFDAGGEMPRSLFCPEFPSRIDVPR